MPVELKISPDPSSDKDKIKLEFEIPQKTKKPPLPDRLASPEAQTQAALQLRQVRAPALTQAREEEAEDAQLEREQAIQSVETPERLQESGTADLARLRQTKEEQLKKAQAKFKERSVYEQKRTKIIKEYKDKARKRAEKYAKVAKEKIEQILAETGVTLGQEVLPWIMEAVTYICLLGFGLCGVVDWVFDAVVSICNLILRALTQYRRVKKAMGLAEKSEVDHLFRDLTEKFLVQTVLPVVGGSILEMIPYLDYMIWEELGVLISGLLIGYDLLKSYRKAKSMENEARSMAGD